MSDAFEAIFDQTQAEQAPAPLPPEPPPVEAPPAQEVAPAQAAEIAPESVTPAPEAAPQERGDKFVPLAAMLDERDKRKALEAKLAEYEASKAQQQPADIPDPYDDPNGYAAYLNSAVQQSTLAVKFDMSEEMAVASHGQETVETAKEWAITRANADPGFKQQMLSSRHPIDWAVRQHRQASDLELYQKDPVAFARSILERNGQQPAIDATAGAVPVVGQQPAATPRPAPPRSIASAPSTGGNPRDVATGPMAALGAVFP